MDVLSEDQALQANLGLDQILPSSSEFAGDRYNLEGFDNDALDIQQLEEFINSDGSLNFPLDDTVAPSVFNPNGRGMDHSSIGKTQQSAPTLPPTPGPVPPAFCQPTASAAAGVPPPPHHHPHHPQQQQQHQQQQQQQQQHQQHHPQQHHQPQQQHPQSQHHHPQQQHLLSHKPSPFCHTQLPDSPPDSGSEPYSPPDGNHSDHTACDVKASIVGSMTSMPQQLYSGGPAPVHHGGPHTAVSPPHHHSPPLAPPDAHMQQQHAPSHKSYPQYSNGEPPKLNHPPQQQLPPVSISHINPQMLTSQFTNMANPGNHPNKKRKYSDSPNSTLTPGVMNGMPGINGMLQSIKQEPNECDYGSNVLGDCSEEDFGYDLSSDQGGMFVDSTYQVIKWQSYQPTKWATLLDANFKEVPTPSYRVDADKGFNFSVPDDAFVCQKKNHFQVTVHVGSVGEPKYVKTADGTKKIDNFYIHFHGIKSRRANLIVSDSPSQSIKVEQSQSDRSKKAFHPIKVELPSDQVTKVTVGRLHFSETTSNNMRKKGKPNPDQRYFMLVVTLHAHSGDTQTMVAAHVSERIIVRASNPGQFDNDVDVLWNKGQTQDSVVHMGRVGVNTDRPDEALTVHGNIKVTGHVVQPSDRRAKQDITELDTSKQLKNVKELSVYKYKYNEDFAEHAGLSEDELEDTGVLAQEVREVLPDAVCETGDLILPSGQRIENFLVVNKDRIYMENVGAVKELCKLTDNLENRIDELERMNKKLKLKRYDSLKSTGSIKSASSCSTISIVLPGSRTGSVIGNGTVGAKKPSANSKQSPPHKHKQGHRGSSASPEPEPSICSNRFIQITVTVLVLVMAFCLVSITTLYILEKQRAGTTDPAVVESADDQLQELGEAHPIQSNASLLQLLQSTPTIEHVVGDVPVAAALKLDPNIILPPDKPFNSTWSPDADTGQQPETQGGPAVPPAGPPAVVPLTPHRCLRETCDVQCCHPSRPLDDRPVVGPGPAATRYADLGGPASSASTVSPKHPHQGRVAPPVKPVKPYSNANDNSLHNKTYHYAVPTGRPTNRPQVKPIETNVHIFMTPKPTKLNDEPDLDSPNPVLDDYPVVRTVDIPKISVNDVHYGRHRRSTASNTTGMETEVTPGLQAKIVMKQINRTIDSVFCTNDDCRNGVGANFTYDIPLSPYFFIAYGDIDFVVSSNMSVKLCHQNTELSCRDTVSSPQPRVIPGSTQTHWSLPIGYYFRSNFHFRVTSTHTEGDACQLPATGLGVTYSEYNLYFRRLCDSDDSLF